MGVFPTPLSDIRSKVSPLEKADPIPQPPELLSRLAQPDVFPKPQLFDRPPFNN